MQQRTDSAILLLQWPIQPFYHCNERGSMSDMQFHTQYFWTCPKMEESSSIPMSEYVYLILLESYLELISYIQLQVHDIFKKSQYTHRNKSSHGDSGALRKYRMPPKTNCLCTPIGATLDPSRGWLNRYVKQVWVATVNGQPETWTASLPPTWWVAEHSGRWSRVVTGMVWQRSGWAGGAVTTHVVGNQASGQAYHQLSWLCGSLLSSFLLCQRREPQMGWAAETFSGSHQRCGGQQELGRREAGISCPLQGNGNPRMNRTLLGIFLTLGTMS